MKFDREVPEEHTPVERTTLRALGLDSFHFEVDESSREGIAPYNQLGNGFWPVMPPPERNEEEQQLHQKAGAAEKERLQQEMEATAVSAQGSAGSGRAKI
jgi:hypothetical protein